MSTTVNVRVVENQVTEKLKEQSEANRFAEENGSGTQLSPAEQQAQQEAAAQAVEAARLSTAQASFIKRDPLRDPIGRRGGSGLFLPNGVEVVDGALVQLGRVGIRWNSNRTRAFVYPWGIEGALGRRLSDNYFTATTEAFAVGVELKFDPPAPKPPPELTGVLGKGPVLFFSQAGRLYERTPAAYTTKRVPRFYTVVEGKRTLGREGGRLCFPDSTDDSSFDKYDFVFEFKFTYGQFQSECYYYAGYNEDQNLEDHFYRSYLLKYIPTTASNLSVNDVYEFALPVGGDKVLLVFVQRALAPRFYSRFLYDYTGRNYVVDESAPFFEEIGGITELETSVRLTGGVRDRNPELFIQDAIINQVKCALVDGSSAREVTPSAQLVAACNTLVKEIDPDDRTGFYEDPFQQQLTYDNQAERTESTTGQVFFSKKETFFNATYSIFEPSNLPKAPYYDIPASQQVLAKQLGIGYLETNDHSGPFYTPAIFEWLNGTATFKTSYADLAPPFYIRGDLLNPFSGVYLSTFRLSREDAEFKATATQPQNVTTAHQPLDWVTINTGSRFGDYLVWDWGNPEYCRQQLEQLGMGFL